jgi:hypothetical protein
LVCREAVVGESSVVESIKIATDVNDVLGVKARVLAVGQVEQLCHGVLLGAAATSM